MAYVGGGGGTLIFSYIRRLEPFILGGVQNLEFQYLWGGGVNGYEDFVDTFGGSSQNWTGFRGHFLAFLGLFLRSIYRMGIFMGFAKISNIIWVCLIFQICFWSKQ